MPYIDMWSRQALQRGDRHEKSAGELNFSVTMLCFRYLKNHGESYQTYNDILGAIEGCKLELYRKKIAPYEDNKIKTNGDIL